MRVRALVVVLLILCTASAAFAASRVFVASTGTDTGTCPRTAPCRTFAYAITQVSPNGEVVALDTAGYGPLTITFAVSIYAAPGEVASITSTSGNDITIAAGPTDQVLLRGLFLNSSGSVKGIVFNSGGFLSVQDTTIANFSSSTFMGLDVERPNGAPQDAPVVDVVNCRFFNNANGIVTAASNGTSITLNVRGSTFEGTNNFAVLVGDTTGATITDSTFVKNTIGVNVQPLTLFTSVGNAQATVERSTFTGNGTALQTMPNSDAFSYINVEYSVITHNSVGVNASPGGGGVFSRSDGTSNQTNTLLQNTSGNAFTGVYPAL